MDYLEIGNTKVEYELITSDRKKTIELVIDFNKGFTVKAPKGMTIVNDTTNLTNPA